MKAAFFRCLRRLGSCDEGQALAELALILPVLILLFLAIMEGGRIMSAYIETQSAARDGCRFAAINCTTLLVPEADVAAWAADILAPWVCSRLSSLDPGKVSLMFQRTVDGTEGEVWVEVTLRYPLEIASPVIGSLIGNPFNLESQVVMRGE